MQPIEYRRLGDPMIIRISVTLGLLFYVGTEREFLAQGYCAVGHGCNARASLSESAAHVLRLAES